MATNPLYQEYEGETPEDIERRRAFANALLQSGVQGGLDYAGPWGAAAKGFQGLMGGLMLRSAKAREARGRQEGAKAFNDFYASPYAKTAMASPTAPATPTAPVPAAGVKPPVPAAAPAPTTVTQANRPLPPGPTQVANISPEDRDYLVRTIYGEAANQTPEGRAAVAHTILNRVKAGNYGGGSVKDVVLAPNQFEPWQSRKGELLGISPQSPGYLQTAKLVDDVVSGRLPDPTGGATHFLNPAVVRARRGGGLPPWAQGEGKAIGDHTFYKPQQVAAKDRGVPGQPMGLSPPQEGAQPPVPVPGQQVAQNETTPDGLSPQLMSILNNPWVSDAQKTFAMKILNDRIDPTAQLERRKLAAEAAKLEAEAAAGGEGTDDIKEVTRINKERAAAGLPPMTTDEWILKRTTAGAARMFEDDPAKLYRIEAIKGSNKEYDTISTAARTATDTKAGLDVLKEALALSPQDPVTGRLAKMFPGASSGAAVVQSIVQRLAPTLRAVGSGSTSDMEFEAMLASLPALVNYPEANTAILAAFNARNQIAIDRGNVARSLMRGKLTMDEYYEQMSEIDNRSIMTPEIKALIDQTEGVNLFDFLGPKKGGEAETPAPQKSPEEIELEKRGVKP